MKADTPVIPLDVSVMSSILSQKRKVKATMFKPLNTGLSSKPASLAPVVPIVASRPVHKISSVLAF